MISKQIMYLLKKTNPEFILSPLTPNSGDAEVEVKS